MLDSRQHQTVLLTEAVSHLAIRPDGIYIDATYGRGGHSRAILKMLNEEGRLYAIDKDPMAIDNAKTLASKDSRFQIIQGSYADLSLFADKLQITGKVSGVLFDLGVSSPQLDDPSRGFSFQHNGPLDMRMDTAKEPNAASWLATATEREIVDVLFTFGEEKHARRIAKNICESRQIEPILTTGQLADIIVRSYPKKKGPPERIHPATRSFQAIRIHINQELSDLNTALPAALQVLAPLGRLVVISFHSLEDRIVKRFMRDEEKGEQPNAAFSRAFHHMTLMRQPTLRRLGKMFMASEEEIRVNPRSRSAKCRVAEKVA